MLSRLPFGRPGGCRAVAPLLWDYAGGALSPEQRAAVEAHLAACARCRGEADAYRRADAALTGYADARPVPNAATRALYPPRWEEVRARIAAEPRTPEPTRRRLPLPNGLAWAGGAAAVAVFAAVGFAGFTDRSGKGADAAGTGTAPASAGMADAAAPLSDYAGSDRPLPPGHERSLGLFAEPVFFGMSPQGVFPIKVIISNHGPALNGRITVSNSHRFGGTQRVVQDVTVAASTQKRLLVYPISTDGTPFTVELTSASGKISTPVTSYGSGYRMPVGYIGDNSFVLEPGGPARKLPKPLAPEYQGAYCKPKDAPDRAVGYSALRLLVLGKGAGRLAPAQWQAIRSWVTAGGNLIVLGAADDALLTSPESASLLPVRAPFYRSAGGSRSVAGTLTPEGRPIPYGPEVLDWANKPQWSAWASRQLGVGRVVFVGENLTALSFRQNPYYAATWNEIFRLTRRPSLSNYANEEGTRSVIGGPRGYAAGNPFALQLPSLRLVTLVFLTYFVLVVPVTFVVLKQMRRLNLAWVTGPTLAVAFAGMTYFLSSGLYTAKASRRTAGLVLAAAGSSEGRFIGQTELFFRKAGSYPVVIPGAELICDDASEYYGSDGAPRAGRDLETWSTPGGMTVPALRVSNLAFRRLYHEQTVRLGGSGLTARLRTAAFGASLVGEMQNDTGRVLRGGLVVVPGPKNGDAFGVARLGDLRPGVTRIHVRVTYLRFDSGFFGIDPIAVAIGRERYRAGRAERQRVPSLTDPVFVGQLSGQEFGPGLGAWAGRDDSVRLVVGLTPLETSEAETPMSEKGGAR